MAFGLREGKKGNRCQHKPVVPKHHAKVRRRFSVVETSKAINRWRNSENIRARWSAKYYAKVEADAERRASEEQQVPPQDTAPSARPKLRPEDTQWGIGRHETCIRPEFVEATIARHAPEKDADCNMKDFAPGFTRSAEKMREIDSRITMIPDPRPVEQQRKKLPPSKLKEPCPTIYPGICLTDDADLHEQLVDIQTNLSTVASTMAKWTLIGTWWRMAVHWKQDMSEMDEVIVVMTDMRYTKPIGQWMALTDTSAQAGTCLEKVDAKFNIKPSRQVIKELVRGRLPYKFTVQRVHATIPKSNTVEGYKRWAEDARFKLESGDNGLVHVLLPGMLDKSMRKKRAGKPSTDGLDADDILEGSLKGSLNEQDKEKLISKWRHILKDKSLLLKKKLGEIRKKKGIPDPGAGDGDGTEKPPGVNKIEDLLPEDSDDGDVGGDATDNDFDEEEQRAYNRHRKGGGFRAKGNGGKGGAPADAADKGKSKGKSKGKGKPKGGK